MEDDETEGTNGDNSRKTLENIESSSSSAEADDKKKSNLLLNNVIEESNEKRGDSEESFGEEDIENEKEEEEEESSLKDLINNETTVQEKINISVYPAMEKKEVIINKKPTIKMDDSNKKLSSHGGKNGKINEYAQYLGLQPATSNKKNCLNCGKLNNNSEFIDNNDNNCHCELIKLKNNNINNTLLNLSPSTSLTNKQHHQHQQQQQQQYNSNNNFNNNQRFNIDKKFKISRKVYKCATCETYFENWNLFIHMKDIHKRFICLYCLGLFATADRLLEHLEKKHHIKQKKFSTVDDFYRSFIGSCYLICCSCEKIFTETDNFYNHYCQPSQTTIDEPKTTSKELSKNHNDDNSISFKRPSLLQQQKKLNSIKSSKSDEKKLLTSYQRKLAIAYERKQSMKNQLNNEIANSDRKNTDNNVPNADENNVSNHEKLNNSSTRENNMINNESKQINELHHEEEDEYVEEEEEEEEEEEKLVIDEGVKKIDDNLSRDTVAETIFQVSKCSDGNNHQDNEDISTESRSSPVLSSSLDEKSIQESLNKDTNCSTDENYPENSLENNYDSVTETIMRVSQLNEEQPTENIPNNYSESSDTSTKNQSDTVPMDVSDNETENKTKKSSVFAENYEKNIWERDKNDGGESSSSSSSDSSSAGENNEDEDDDYDEDDDNNTTEINNQPTVSVSSVNTDNRRLVIKICTNKNSSFHVSATSNGISEPLESEENNNKEENNSDSDNDNLEPLDDRPKSPKINEESLSTTGGTTTPPPPHEQSLNSSAESPSKIVTNNIEEEEDQQQQQQLNTVTKEPEEQQQQQQQQEQEQEIIEPLSFLPTTGDVQNFPDPMEQEEAPPPVAEEPEQLDKTPAVDDDGIVLASEDIPMIDVDVTNTLESTDIMDLLKSCIKSSSIYCIYCNHARKIAVNGKQLALHMLAEHNFQPQHPAIIINKSQFITRVKKSIDELSDCYLNYDTYDSTLGTYNVPKSRRYECFHCRYTSLLHKDVYQHNRKMHQKTILICTMCNLTFFSYSELLCHLCPGTTPQIDQSVTSQLNQIPSLTQSLNDIKYRCCNCNIKPLPSAFRLMVHLRKTHDTCDICLETTQSQQKLSNHIWKHKIIHPCYRCGISYRNKPDITNHLFWKHGTESVVCKKCLQKKWPHIYHFCIPTNSFLCEECNSTFKSAVSLKVHKRLHINYEPYECNVCFVKFISKKALSRHDRDIHNPPVVEKNTENSGQFMAVNGIDAEPMGIDVDEGRQQDADHQKTSTMQSSPGEQAKKDNEESSVAPPEIVKKVVDVYDLPPLNLSSDSDSDSDEEVKKKEEEGPNKPEEKENNPDDAGKVDNENEIVAAGGGDEVVDDQQQVTIMNGIWNNFKSYRMSLGGETPEEFGLNTVEDIVIEKTEEEIAHEKRQLELLELIDSIIAEHDYCVVYPEPEEKEGGDKDTENKENNAVENGEEQKKDEEKEEENNKTVVIDETVETQVVENVDAVDGVVAAATVVTTEEAPVTSEEKPAAASNEDENEKKKIKSPKKKKKGNDGNGLSSSSDSSSDSDSSNCSCGSNCSCSSSSSGSSSSSSSSSDSDSSESEGSPKKTAGNHKKERTKKDKKGDDQEQGEVGKKDTPGIEISQDGQNMTINESLTNEERQQNIHEIISAIPPPDPYEEEQKRIKESKLILRESDLDTTESETDEDFYDEHPQKLALKLLEEKRNQLIIASAPPTPEPINPLQNGITQDSPEVQQKNSSPKKKVRGRKRKKSSAKESNRLAKPPKGQRGRKIKYPDGQTNSQQQLPPQVPAAQTVESIKLNIPNRKAYRTKQKIRFSLPNNTKFATSSPSVPPPPPPAYNSYSMNNSFQHVPIQQNTSIQYHTPLQHSISNSGSESETKRSSKRRRKPKRFYDDSSDEEAHLQEKLLKFRRTDPPPPHLLPPPLPPSLQQQQQQQIQPAQIPMDYNQAYQPITPQPAIKTVQQQPYIPSIRIKQNFGNSPMVIQNKISSKNQQQSNYVIYNNESTGNLPGGSVSDSDDANDTSSDSSESDNDDKMQIDETPRRKTTTTTMSSTSSASARIAVDNNTGVTGPTSGAKLYCYCRCPYDEVSEMIACDSKNCKIEWFHFECVGIVTPPKGNWFCPDCKKTDPNAPKDEMDNN